MSTVKVHAAIGEGWGRESPGLVTAAGGEAAGGRGMKNVFAVVIPIHILL